MYSVAIWREKMMVSPIPSLKSSVDFNRHVRCQIFFSLPVWTITYKILEFYLSVLDITYLFVFVAPGYYWTYPPTPKLVLSLAIVKSLHTQLVHILLDFFPPHFPQKILNCNKLQITSRDLFRLTDMFDKIKNQQNFEAKLSEVKRQNKKLFFKINSWTFSVARFDKNICSTYRQTLHFHYVNIFLRNLIVKKCE